jgi:hypothetical protein
VQNRKENSNIQHIKSKARQTAASCQAKCTATGCCCCCCYERGPEFEVPDAKTALMHVTHERQRVGARVTQGSSASHRFHSLVAAISVEARSPRRSTTRWSCRNEASKPSTKVPKSIRTEHCDCQTSERSGHEEVAHARAGCARGVVCHKWRERGAVQRSVKSRRSLHCRTARWTDGVKVGAPRPRELLTPLKPRKCPR